MQLGLATKDVAAATPWDYEVLKQQWDESTWDRYEVRVHLYQGRQLPSADDSGALDPYVIAKIGHGEASRRASRNPF